MATFSRNNPFSPLAGQDEETAIGGEKGGYANGGRNAARTSGTNPVSKIVESSRNTLSKIRKLERELGITFGGERSDSNKAEGVGDTLGEVGGNRKSENAGATNDRTVMVEAPFSNGTRLGFDDVDISGLFSTGSASGDLDDGEDEGNSQSDDNVGASRAGRSRMSKLSKRIKDITAEVDETKKYPRDCYSFISINGPDKDGWKREKLKFFLFGLSVSVLQIVFCVLLMLSVVVKGIATIDETDNPDAGKPGVVGILANFVPADCPIIITVTQIVSLLTYVIFPETSVEDLIKGLQYWPKFKKGTDHDPIGCMRFACCMRIISGALAIISAFILVVTSHNVIDIILNFTAMNFVSEIDDRVFSLVEDGVFGPDFEKHADDIVNKSLPKCMQHKRKHFLHFRIQLIITAVFIAMLALIMVYQNSDNYFVTRKFRLEFHDEDYSQFGDYSGCFIINNNSRAMMSENRRTFHSFDNKTTIGYCKNDRKWVLYKGMMDETNPCDVDEESAIARSTKTEDYDIGRSLEDEWFYKSSSEDIQLVFETEEKVGDLYCEGGIGNGRCDATFNTDIWHYDDGDCCATECNHVSCQIERNITVFGDGNKSAISFPDCKKPGMKNMTIRLTDIKSSRDEDFTAFDPCKLDLYEGRDEGEWRNATPMEPRMTLICDEKTILSTLIDVSMQSKTETVKVPDGANCTVSITNATNRLPYPELGEVDILCEPIWYVNYTIFHNDTTTTETDQIEILTNHSSKQDTAHFRRIPDCYFEMLEDYIDVPSIYTASGSSTNAIKWLQSADSTDLLCEVNHFTEKYALSLIIFAMNGTDALMEGNEQCLWSWVKCESDYSGGNVNQIRMPPQSLEGPIPSELSLLTKLNHLELSENHITFIPTEIGLLTALERLSLRSNNITNIPNEIGSLVNLKFLIFNNNEIKSIPDEVGMLTELEILSLYDNSIQSIPRNISMISELRMLDFGKNNVSSIPSEIGLMTNSDTLLFESNQIRSIPTEFGLLTSLHLLRLDSNQIRSIPTEFGLLTSLRSLVLGKNNISSIPSEIGLMTNSDSLFFDSNQIRSIPTEFGLLTSLKNLQLFKNQIRSVPSELGRMTNLNDLSLSFNSLGSIPSVILSMKQLEKLHLEDIDLKSIPTEIGMMENLVEIRLNENQIGSIPTELGLMTNLKNLQIHNNSITSIPTEFGLMTNLSTISMGLNPIGSIPTEILSMKQLTDLHIDGIQLSSIPTEIGLMSNLETLALGQNVIESIPTEIGLLTNLKVLFLGENSIESVPSEIVMLTNLELLWLDSNDIIQRGVDDLCSSIGRDRCLFGGDLLSAYNDLPGLYG